MNDTDTDRKPLDLVIAANFTAEPVEPSIQYWLRELQLPVTVRHAPFDQVFQQLLDPNSLLRSNHKGIGLVLVRLQDWIEGASNPDGVAQEFTDAVREALSGAASQLVIAFCPATGLDGETRVQVTRAERAVTDALREQSGVRVLTSDSVLERYPDEKIADEHGARLASMPYTPAGFCMLGTALARSVYGLLVPAHKVLVLDCDDTLWGGLCSELGPQGVAVTGEHLALQRFALEQRRDGKLLCLASRNNEADVLAVFDQHPAMALTRDDLTAWQVHWGLKSDSLADLADRLGLGLDSFVFLDDDPVQCAEVRRRFPEVLALQVPKHGVAEFCRHIWPLDPRSSTAEGSRRTGSYRDHVAREDVRASSGSFQQFLDSLELDVRITPLDEPDLARATELTHRTNQFNLTGLRINEAEFRNRLLDKSTTGFGVRVSDRFGDYGLVGLILAESAGETLRVPVLLLSCRALGRGVEHRMVAHLGRLARETSVRRIDLRCIPTKRNDPAREFLQQLGEVGATDDGTLTLSLDTREAEAVTLNLDAAPQRAEPGESSGAMPTGPDAEQTRSRVEFLASIPQDLATLEAILAAVQGQAGQPPASGQSETTNPVESRLIEAFREQLAIEEIPLDVGFFELGGESLQAMQILSQVSAGFGIELDTTLLFTTNFSVSELAEEIQYLWDPETTDPVENPGPLPATTNR